MYAPQSTIVCPTCGQENPATAAFCAMCGAVIDGAGDPLANSVSGSPAPAAPTSLRHGLDDARSRIEQLVPEVAATLAERMARLHRLPPPSPSAARLRMRHRGLRTVQTQWRLRRLGRLSLWLPTLQPVPAPVPTVPPIPIPARIAWFVFAGIWLTGLWVVATWVTLCTIVGRPLAARMLDLMPTVLTLRPPGSRYGVLPVSPGLLPIPHPGVPQHELVIRAAYFLFVGWWASLVWMILAYVISLSAVGMPLAYRMFGLTPTVAHLERR